MENMTISRAIDILAPLNKAKSVDSGVAYLFTEFVNAGKAPDRPTGAMTTEKRHLNLAISYADEYIKTGKVS